MFFILIELNPIFVIPNQIDPFEFFVSLVKMFLNILHIKPHDNAAPIHLLLIKEVFLQDIY